MAPISDDRRSGRGGKRAGAGRKCNPGRRRVPHRTRPSLSPKHPVHVVLRVADGQVRGGLRNGRVYGALRRVLKRYLGRGDFRVVHLSIQRDHLHLLVEASDRRALWRGMQSFAINAARAIHAARGTSSRLFAGRYHATQITNALQGRNALTYVLNNWRKHKHDLLPRTRGVTLDPYASGFAFAGWSPDARKRIERWPDYEPLSVSPPLTRILASDWKIWGFLDPFTRPGRLV